MLSLIPLFPLAGFVVNAMLGRRLPKGVSGGLAGLARLASFVVSVMVVSQLAGMAPDARVMEQTVYTWIASGTLDNGEAFGVDLAFRLDPLSAVMLLFVTFIGTLIHVYSVGYMGHDEGYGRFFAYLNLFMFSMLTLVLADNFLLMFVGWEGVGLCSYLLIGYYFTRGYASDAAKKAFIVNRIGDFGFALGMILLFYHAKTIFYFDNAVHGAGALDWAARIPAADPFTISAIFAAS